MTAGTHLISPRFQASKVSPGTFEDWVDVYEDRTWGWHLQHADGLKQRGEAAWFVILQLAVAFFEPYEIFRTGTDSDRRSQEFFRAAFRRIFPGSRPSAPAEELDDVADEIYKQVRCGYFHAGFPRSKVMLVGRGDSVTVLLEPTTNRVAQIIINPVTFLDAVIAEFRRYVAVLRDPQHPHHQAMRAPFERAWHLVHRQ